MTQIASLAENFPDVDKDISTSSLGTHALEEKVCTTKGAQEQCSILKMKQRISVLNHENQPDISLSTVKENNEDDEGKQGEERIFFPDIVETAMEEKDFSKALSMAFTWFFQEDETVGLGFHLDENQKDAIYADNNSLLLVAKLKQIKKLNRTGNISPWDAKLKTSVLQAHMEHSLFQKGYSKKAKSENEGKSVKYKKICVSSEDKDTTVEDFIENNTNSDSSSIIRNIQNKDVLGALDLKATLPVGVYLYFSPDGYPIYVSQSDNETPDIDLFERNTDQVRDSNPDSISSKIDFLKHNLQVGDILTLNEKDKKKGLIKKMILKGARASQSMGNDEVRENFHSIHTAVYIGNGKIAHIRKKGLLNNDVDTKVLPLESLFNRYNGVSVSRMDLDKDTRGEFAESAKKFITGVTSYSSDRALETGENGLVGTETELPTTYSELICTDPLRLAAQSLLSSNSEISNKERSELEKLQGANMAKNIFDNFYSPYSFNI